MRYLISILLDFVVQCNKRRLSMEQKEYWDSVSEEKKFTTPFQTEAFGQYVKKTAVVMDVR